MNLYLNGKHYFTNKIDWNHYLKIGYCISQYCRVLNKLMSATACPKNYCNPILVVPFWWLDFMSLPLKLNECTMYYRRYKKLICLSKIAIWYCCYMYSINDTCFVYCRQNNWVFREGLKKEREGILSSRGGGGGKEKRKKKKKNSDRVR